MLKNFESVYGGYLLLRPCSFQWEIWGVGWVSVGKGGKEWVRVGKSGIFFKCGKGGKGVGESW